MVDMQLKLLVYWEYF